MCAGRRQLGPWSCRPALSRHPAHPAFPWRRHPLAQSPACLPWRWRAASAQQQHWAPRGGGSGFRVQGSDLGFMARFCAQCRGGGCGPGSQRDARTWWTFAAPTADAQSPAAQRSMAARPRCADALPGWRTGWRTVSGPLLQFTWKSHTSTSWRHSLLLSPNALLTHKLSLASCGTGGRRQKASRWRTRCRTRWHGARPLTAGS